MKVKEHDGHPHLCLYALQDIASGTELRYDYAAPNLWWRNTVSIIYLPLAVKKSITFYKYRHYCFQKSLCLHDNIY